MGKAEGAVLGQKDGASVRNPSVGPTEGLSEEVMSEGAMVPGPADREGLPVGPSLGCSEGDSNGIMVIGMEGDWDGLWLGGTDGISEGIELDRTDGEWEGTRLGTSEGRDLGGTDGMSEGLELDRTVGT